MKPPLHHAYMKYLDTLPKEQAIQHITENIKTAMRKTYICPSPFDEEDLT